jgi:hypothetical protein
MKIVKMVLRIFLILVVALVVIVFFNPFVGLIIKYNEIEIAAAMEDLPVARAKWEEQNIDHYSFEIWATNHVCIASARVEVRNEKVVQVNFKDYVTGDVSNGSISPSLWTNENFPIDAFSCHYAPLTMTYLFDKAEQYLNIRDSRCLVKVSFDKTYGFVSKARLQIPPYGRMAHYNFDGCLIGFDVENFQVLDE